MSPRTEITVSEIFIRAGGEAQHLYSNTPPDFISRHPRLMRHLVTRARAAFIPPSLTGVPAMKNYAQRLSRVGDDYSVGEGVPLVALISGAILAPSCMIARFHLIVEVFVGLRALPPDAYAAVNWSKYMPHI